MKSTSTLQPLDMPTTHSLTSQLMQNYRLSAPVVAGSQIAAGSDHGQSTVFSIGTSGHVFRITADPASDTGWNLTDLAFPGEARFLAAMASPDKGITAYACDTKNQIYREGGYRQLVAHNGLNKFLYVFAIESDGFAHLAAWQDASGHWYPGFKFPDQPIRLTSLLAGTGHVGSLQLIGLGEDGLAYVVGSQDPTTGKWSTGGPLPSQGKWTALAVGVGNNGELQVIGLDTEGRLSVVAWIDFDGGWKPGTALPTDDRYKAIATGRGNDLQLQVIGVTTDGKAKLAAYLNNFAQWMPGGDAINLDVKLTDVAAGNGSYDDLEVIGLGEDGFAYLVAWQDNDGNWFQGFKLPDQQFALKKLAVGSAIAGQMEVIGLSRDSDAVHVAHLDGGGGWSAGKKLVKSATWTDLALGNGNKDFLQVLGVPALGSVNLVAWMNQRAQWVPGQRRLATAWQPLPASPGNVVGMKVGYEADGKPFLVISKVSKRLLLMLQSFSILQDGKWENLGLGSPKVFDWTPALVPYSAPLGGIRRGVYSSMVDTPFGPAPGIFGLALTDQSGESIVGNYSKVSAANTGSGYSELFGLSSDDQRVYYLAATDNPQRLLIPTNVSGDAKVAMIAAGSDARGLAEVFAVTSNGLLYHSRKDPASETGWSLFLKLHPSIRLSRLVASKTPDGFSEVFAVTTKGELYRIFQDPDSSDWRFDQIDLPKRNDVEEFSSYNVLMTVYDRSEVPAPESPVQIFSEAPVTLEINQVTTFVDPETPWSGTTNAAGQVTIGIKTDALGVSGLTASTIFLPEGGRICIDPSAPARHRLSSLNVDTLRKAEWTADDGARKPVFKRAESDANLEAVATAVNTTFSLKPPPPGAVHFTSKRVYQNHDQRVAWFQPAYDGSAPGKIHASALADQFFHVDLTPGRPRFRSLTFDECQALEAQLCANPHAASVRGFGVNWGDVVDWGDVFDAIADGVAKVRSFLACKIGDAIHATLELVINGAKAFFRATIDAVEQLFDLAQEVFKAVGAGFEKLYRWVGFIFNWGDILRTHEVINYGTKQVAEFSKAVIEFLKGRIDTYISTLESDVRAKFQGIINGVAGENSMLGFQQEYAPAQPEQAMSIDHNVVWTGLMNNGDRASSPKSAAGTGFEISAEAAAAVADLMTLLDQTASQFQQSDPFRQAREFFSQATSSPDKFVSAALAGLLSVVEGAVLWTLEAAKALAKAILDAAARLTDELIEILEKPWDVPFVSDLYHKFTGSTLTTLDLGSLIAAVPATVIYKAVVGEAPYPDQPSVDRFKAVFNAKVFLQRSGLQRSGTRTPLETTEISHARQVAGTVMGIVGYVADWSHSILLGVLDAASIPETRSIGSIKTLEQWGSRAVLVLKLIGQGAKVPWIASDQKPSCESKEGFATIIWMWDNFPFAVDLVYYFKKDATDAKLKNERIARVSGEVVGPVLASVLGTVEGALLLTKHALPGKFDDWELAFDILTFVPEFGAFGRLKFFNPEPGAEYGLIAITAADVLCGVAAALVGLIQIVQKAKGDSTLLLRAAAV